MIPCCSDSMGNRGDERQEERKALSVASSLPDGRICDGWRNVENMFGEIEPAQCERACDEIRGTCPETSS